MNWIRFVPAFLLLGVTAAQPPLELKGLRGGRPTGRYTGSQHHLIIQFKQHPSAQNLQLLRERGASILEYVPQFGYVVSTPENISLADLDLQWAGPLTAHEKVSPAFKENPASRASFAVVEFYSDVSMDQARAIVLAANLEIHENPDLLPNNLLVSGSTEALALLAKRDEVEYLYPASDDLVAGRSVNACPGALTDQGPVGQSVLKVGGWGPVGTSASLQYAFVNTTEKLATTAAESEIVRALSTWSKYVQVNWAETTDITGAQTVAILFARGAHGDGYPFSGPGGVVAHTFYPYPYSSEPIAGDMHFNDDENWQIGTNIDLFSVALHETGHALGLGHSDQPGAVMYPYYHQVVDLSAEDIAAIQTLYAKQGAVATPAPFTLDVIDPASTTSSSTLNLSGSTTGGVPPVLVTWLTDSQISGTAEGSATWTIHGIPLHLGANSITIRAMDSQKNDVSRTLSIALSDPPPATPTLLITSPIASGTYYASGPSVTLAGTASYAYDIARISWTVPGASGIAQGTNTWIAGPIPLAPGATGIAVTALTADGKTAGQSIQVVYTPLTTATGGAGAGTAPPALSILNPAAVTLAVTSPTEVVSGTASSPIGLSSITWTTSNGDSGTAAGTAQWSVLAIPLMVGANTITIRAYDSNGASSWRSLIVTRYSSN